MGKGNLRSLPCNVVVGLLETQAHESNWRSVRGEGSYVIIMGMEEQGK